MSAIHVVVRPHPSRAPSPALAPLYGLFDVVIDGVNITARIGEGQAFALLAELAHAVAALSSGRRDRSCVQLYADAAAWELGLEADGENVLITVYRGGAEPEVAVHERRVALSAFRDALLAALLDAQREKAPATVRGALLGAAQALEADWPPVRRSAAKRNPVTITPRTMRGFALSATAPLRTAAQADGAQDPQLERADLHALLARGEVRMTIRGRTVTLPSTYVFLLAERLVLLADEVLDGWRAGRAVFRRIELASVRFGVRRGPGDAALALTVGATANAGEGSTFPELSTIGFVQACARYALAVCEAFVRNDPAQARNLRLLALSSSAEALCDQAADDETPLTNPAPETYRTFALPTRRATSRGVWEHGGKMRFVAKWVATVPGIDLKSTFLCGELLIIGAARETACIARASGSVVWRVSTPRAGCVATPAGLVRIQPDGRVLLHDLDSGDVRFTRRLTPRAAGGACGAVVHAAGLPKLIVLAEGDRKVTAIDLVSGDVRWRYTGRRPAAYRIRRAGRLVLVAGGDAALLALDAATGEVVWRVRDRAPFTGDVIVDHDAAFAVNGTANGPSRVHCLDPWSGEVRWSAELEERTVPGQAPLVTPEVIVVPVRDRRGIGACAFSRATGEPLWEHAPGLLEATTAWLAVDDSIVANSSAGTLLCIDATTGALRYNHVFSRQVDADQPRRLEPVLRSGALFVPQHQVHVVRPRDGEIIGTVPTDLIPDLLRVDERCDVYVAEESGHVAAFGVAPRLTLVK
jgi:outer membrane protein assembly factor BamB